MARENPFLDPTTDKNEIKQRETDQRVVLIELKAFQLLQVLPVGTREAAIAQTKLEDAIMWCKRAVRL